MASRLRTLAVTLLVTSSCAGEGISERDAARLLGLSLPIREALGDRYLDGGSVGLVIEDASFRRVEFVALAGVDTPPEDRGVVFLRGRSSEAERLSQGSPEAAAGSVLTSRWLRRTYSRAELAKLRDAPDASGDPSGFRVYVAQKFVEALESLAE
jgi:hypothetical protein